MFPKYDHGPWPNNLEKYKGKEEWFAKGDEFVAVVLKEKKLIGFISKGKKEGKVKEFDFGYIFQSNFQSKRNATENCKASIDFLFEVSKADKISTSTAKINKTSNKLLKRLGFITREE